jgi:hypothetical protein
MDDTDVCSKLLLHLYTSRVLKNAEVIYYTLLCHPILRDKPCDMTKRCDFKFVFDDVEKHIDSFLVLMLKNTDPDVKTYGFYPPFLQIVSQDISHILPNRIQKRSYPDFSWKAPGGSCPYRVY